MSSRVISSTRDGYPPAAATVVAGKVHGRDEGTEMTAEVVGALNSVILVTQVVWSMSTMSLSLYI